ncbi:zinc finger BED domain-containing protein RICESLEEPER 2-like [Zingiber officinale]|uniref:zinc finger BED domain-containing protein RICESLEEPER 2-like n=1 Tax=Zingiber officinale TaxID=94328 RepID=UPI001C4C28BB|nr:zinc finger BED domain-containing protein RICESLEEPER 2-like [Zingiber officinale]
MVVTGHWIDSCWNLQKRVLSFSNIPPPRRGLQISDAIFKCMKGWGIENKVFTITVDSASNNDLAIRYMKDTIQRSRTLACEGNLFHICCCAHILNLCVQDGLREIEDIISNIRESVEYENRLEVRRVQFIECVQQLQLKDEKLIRDCTTRWNSTFEMLSCALKFKEVFQMFKECDHFYGCCPQEEEWNKAQKICSLLETFWITTHIISGSEYPTSNLFLQEVQKIKSSLDTYAQHEDLFLKQLASKMKEKFDKYWGDCNLLMAITVVLDPTKKNVKEIINSLYEKYVVEETNNGAPHPSESESFGSSSVKRNQQSSVYSWDDFDNYCAKVETSEIKRSELFNFNTLNIRLLKRRSGIVGGLSRSSNEVANLFRRLYKEVVVKQDERGYIWSVLKEVNERGGADHEYGAWRAYLDHKPFCSRSFSAIVLFVINVTQLGFAVLNYFRPQKQL